MKQYFTGFFTAVCLTASVFIFMGSQNKNLGVIEADSISITSEVGTTLIIGGGIFLKNEDGNDVSLLAVGDNGGSFFETHNADGKQTSYLGTAGDGSGHLRTYNADGKMTSYLGTGGDGNEGKLSTYNVHGVETGYFGTNTENDGIIVLSDKYGDAGWAASGKQ